jgi:hypothetical protein
MRPMRRLIAPLLALASLAALACAGGRAPAPAEPRARVFVAERALEDLSALAALGPRPTGSDGAAGARAHLRAALETLGIEVRELALELPPAPGDDAASARRLAVQLIGVIPGESPDLVLLGASYDTAPGAGAAADAAASGPAVLLELGRAIAAKPLPYTTWLAFLDGDLGGAAAESRAGSQAFAQRLAADGALAGIRLALFFRRVGGPDLRVQRDLRSHRIHREAVWRAAAGGDARGAFPPDAGFATPPGAHLSLLEVGMRRVVLLAGADDALEPRDDVAGRCSRESLAAVGQVSLDALDEITRTLVKVDRLVPAGGARKAAPEAESPAPEPAAPDAGGAPPSPEAD